MGKIPFEIAGKSIDTGFVDTISLFMDIFKLANERKNYKELEIPSKQGFIRKKKLIVPSKVSGLVDKILATDFEQKSKKIKIKVKGKYVEEFQIYYINDTLSDYIFYYDPRKYHLSIMIQHSELLGKAEEEIINDIKDVFRSYFGVTNEYLNNLEKATKLSRIDFKRDYRYKDEQELSLIKFIVEIAPNTIVGKNYQKKDEKDEHSYFNDFDNYEYMKKYKSPSNKTAEFVIYDKQLEQETKFRKNKISNEQLEYFKNVIRFEVRIKNRKLNSLKKDKNWALDKKIDNYKDEYVADELFSQYAELAFFKEPFYRIDYAIRLIYKSEKKPNMRKKLVKLIKLINEKGYTKAKEQYNSRFNAHISILRNELGINPLTFGVEWIDKNGNTHKTTYTTIPNFIQKESCMYDSNEEVIIPSKLRKLMEQEKDKGT